MDFHWKQTLSYGFAVGCFAGSAGATLPYTPVSLTGTPGIGPGLISPAETFGKEYSHDEDYEITAVGVSPDPQQIVAWDGSGGVADGLDFSFTRPSFTPDLDIDAIANHNDALFSQLLEDRAHLIFSVDDEYTVYTPGGPAPASLPAGTPPGVALINGNVIGGSGEVSYELATLGGLNPVEAQGLWADQAKVNGMPLPRDVDGLEVWGPEPGFTADTDKYSLDTDAISVVTGGGAVSVWNGSGSPYIGWSTISTAVTSLLGPIPTAIEPESINLDALMVNDVAGEIDDFGRDPANGTLDEIIFSIRQIADPTDADGYYATGSELFLLDAAGGVTFLAHGGHLWDHAYTLSAFGIGSPSNPDQNYGVFDINAIEAVGEVVPEPATVLLMGLASLAAMARRNDRA